MFIITNYMLINGDLTEYPYHAEVADKAELKQLEHELRKKHNWGFDFAFSTKEVPDTKPKPPTPLISFQYKKEVPKIFFADS